MEIERMLAASMEEERQMKEFQMNEMKKSWSQSIQYKRELASQPPPKDFDSENAGPAAALRFFGEDSNRANRLQQQKQQLQKWIQEQVAEKAHLRHLQREEDMSYAEMIKAIDDVREATEREEREMRKYIQDTVKQYNKELALRQQDRNHQRNTMDADAATSLDLFNEDKCTAMNPDGRIIRPDMFKGFTEEQRKRILLDNQQIIQDKKYVHISDPSRYFRPALSSSFDVFLFAYEFH